VPFSVPELVFVGVMVACGAGTLTVVGVSACTMRFRPSRKAEAVARVVIPAKRVESYARR